MPNITNFVVSLQSMGSFTKMSVYNYPLLSKP